MDFDANDIENLANYVQSNLSILNNSGTPI